MLSLCPSSFGASRVPFLAADKPQVEANGNDALAALLVQEIEKQRDTNLELRTYTRASRKARLEKKLIETRLKAEGYYKAKVTIDKAEKKWIYRVLPGPLYRISHIDILAPDEITLSLAKEQGIKVNAPLKAEAVLRSQARITKRVEQQNCLFNVQVNYDVTVFHSSQSAELVFSIAPSPQVTYGDIRFEGQTSIDPSYLRDRIDIKTGACFKRTDIDTSRLQLLQTNLLASIDVALAEPKDKRVDVIFHVKERHHKTLSLGGGYDADNGFGVLFAWEHRNIARRAQKLDFEARVAERYQLLESRITLPHFKKLKQHVVTFVRAANQDRDGYKSKSATLGVEISRQIRGSIRGSAGLEWAFSRVLEDGEETDFALISMPLTVEQDRRNDLLDPRKGWVLSAKFTPFSDAYDSDIRFTKSSVAASFYYSISSLPWRPTLALRTATGAISGAERDQVPANLRYYVGGGGSVRGYPFQTLGPLTDAEPDGGLSFNEYALEARFYWGQNWGGVVFVDGGLAYENPTPQIGEDLLWGAGLGLRFYTGFAPIRFDAAFPLMKRDEIDDPFQLYISIGQAF